MKTICKYFCESLKIFSQKFKNSLFAKKKRGKRYQKKYERNYFLRFSSYLFDDAKK